ncbi:MAG: Asp/Glu racemase [Candidatus Tectomicrobia bacterium]|nr:Asp/Glu racemase [Candidatus Tectomicrobia bacterium]
MTRPTRIGVLVPSTNQVVEPDFAALVPPGVTFHTERLWNGDATPPGGGDGTYLQKMNDDLERGAKYLASANVDILSYGCTSGTYHAGTIDYDNELKARMTAASGLPAVTAVSASIEALKHVGATAVGVLGPYGTFLLEQRLTPLFESQGLTIISTQGEPEMLQRTHDAIIGDQEPEHIAAFVCQAVDPKADVIFLPGTAWRALEIVDQLEKAIGKVVITVNQATIWATFRELGIERKLPGYGRLFSE